MTTDQLKQELYNRADHSLLYTSKAEWNEKVDEFVDGLPWTCTSAFIDLPILSVADIEAIQEKFEEYIS